MNDNNQNDLNAIIDNIQPENQPVDIPSEQNNVSTPEPVQEEVQQSIQPEQIVSIQAADNVSQTVETQDVIVGGSPQPFYNVENLQNQPPIQDNQAQTVIKEKRKSAMILLIPILIIFIGGILVLLDRFYLVTGDRIIKNEVKTVFSLMKNGIDAVEKNSLSYDLEKESLGLNGEITMSSDYETDEFNLKKLKDYKITYDGVIDKNNNKLSANVSLLKNDSPLVAANGYIDGKTLLVQSNQVLSNTLKISLDEELKEFDTTKSINYKSINKLVSRVEEVTLNSIDKSKISKTSVKKTINGKETSVLKVSYTFKMNELAKLYSEDEEIATILAELYNVEKSEIKQMLNNDYSNNNEDLILDVYCDPIVGMFKAMDITTVESDNEYATPSTISITKNKNIYNFSTVEGNDNLANGSYDTSSKTFNVSIKVDYDTTVNITYKTIKKGKYKINIDVVGDEYSFAVEGNITTTVSSKKQTNNTVLSINYKADTEQITFELNSNYTLEKGRNTTPLTATNVVDYEEIPENEVDSAMTKLSEIMETVIKDVAPGYEPNNSYDYGYDFDESEF